MEGIAHFFTCFLSLQRDSFNKWWVIAVYFWLVSKAAFCQSTWGLGTFPKGWRFQTLTLKKRAGKVSGWSPPTPGVRLASKQSSSSFDQEKREDQGIWKAPLLLVACSSLQTMHQQSHLPRLHKASVPGLEIQILCSDAENKSTGSTIFSRYRIRLNTYPNLQPTTTI